MFQGPTPPLSKLPKSLSKMHQNVGPQKKCKIRPKMVPKGDPKSAKKCLKSAFAAFFGLRDPKNEAPGGPSKKGSIFEWFWDPPMWLKHSKYKQKLSFEGSLKVSILGSILEPFWEPKPQLYSLWGALGRLLVEKRVSQKPLVFWYPFFHKNDRTCHLFGVQWAKLFGTFFDLFCKILPKLPQTP